MKKILLVLFISALFIGTLGCEEKNIQEPSQEKESTQEVQQTSKKERDKYTEEEYKGMCEKLDYKSIARNPEANKEKKVYGTGEIIQVIEESGKYASFRINVTPVMNYDNTKIAYYEDTILVYTFNYDSNNRLLEDDIIDFWGIVAGNYTYETVMGSNMTIPSIQVDYFKLK